MFELLTNAFKTILSKKCQRLYCVFYGREIDRCTRLLRFVLSFMLGYVLSYLLWKLIAINFDFSKHLPGIPLYDLFLTINGLNFALSASVRSITLLIFVALVGTSGRGYLRAMAFAFVIAGPIANLALNGAEIARVFACTTVLTYNLTKNRFDLMTKPFTQTLAHMKDNLSEVETKFNEMHKILEPIRQEVEVVEVDAEPEELEYKEFLLAAGYRTTRNVEVTPTPNASQVQQRFTKNMRTRCTLQLNRAKQRCRRMHALAHAECQKKFVVIVRTLLCWPYRLNAVCQVNIFGNPDEVCDPGEAIPANFGDTYVELSAEEHELYQNNSNVQLKYEFQHETIVDELDTAEATARAFTDEFETHRRVFGIVMIVLQNFLCLFIIRLIWESLMYFRKYRRIIDFDNFYITDYFKKVDARRKAEHKRAILPLKKYERSKYVDINDMFSRTGEESKSVVYLMLMLSLEIITVAFFLLLDYLLANMMSIVREHSQITYLQQGKHNIRFHINGTGLLAHVMRATMLNFNIHERIYTSLSNEDCLPRPTILPRSFYIKLLLIYLTIIVLICQSTAFLRLRRIICSFYFEKREKRRILFLYNRMLRLRHSEFDVLRTQAERNLANHLVYSQLNILLRLRLRYPNKYNWLTHFKLARRKCLVCGALEDANFVICSNCSLPYCRECSLELRGVCINCENLLVVMHTSRPPPQTANAKLRMKSSILKANK